MRSFEDLDTLLDEIGLPKAGLLGMSQGGRVALQYAMTRPHRVTGLVLQGVPLDDPPARTTGDSSLLPLERFAEMVRRGNKDSLVRELEQHPLTERRPAPRPGAG